MRRVTVAAGSARGDGNGHYKQVSPSLLTLFLTLLVSSSPRSSASQWSTTSDFSDVGGQHQNQQNMVTLLPASMWAHKIMPLCLAKAAQSELF